MTASFLAFSVVMLLCSVCNVGSMILNIDLPRALPWLGGWFVTALAVGGLVYVGQP